MERKGKGAMTCAENKRPPEESPGSLFRQPRREGALVNHLVMMASPLISRYQSSPLLDRGVTVVGGGDLQL